MALIQATLSEIDEECLDVLHRALAEMNAAYDAGQSYIDIQNLAGVPTAAFISAVESRSGVQ